MNDSMNDHKITVFDKSSLNSKKLINNEDFDAFSESNDEGEET